MEYADVLVIDDFPVYMPRRISEIAISLGKCEVHCVDSNGFISMRQDRDFTTAYSLRRHLHKTIIQHMSEFLCKPRCECSWALDLVRRRSKPSSQKATLLPLPTSSYGGFARLKILASKHYQFFRLDHSVPPVQHTQGWVNSSTSQME